MGRRTVWVLLLALLGLTGAIGFYNGVTEWDDAHTGLQRSVTAAVLLYGVAGLAAAYGLALRRRWCIWTAAAWCVGTTYAGSVAAIAYGGADASAGGALAAGIACILIAAATLWGVRASTRSEVAKPDDVQLNKR